MRAHDRLTENRVVAGILNSCDHGMLRAAYKRLRIFEAENQQHLKKIRSITMKTGHVPSLDSYLNRGDVSRAAGTALANAPVYEVVGDFERDLAVLDSYIPAVAVTQAMLATQQIVSQNDSWDTVKPEDLKKVVRKLKEAIDPVADGKVVTLSAATVREAQQAARQACQQDRVTKWPTGWEGFDEATRGGLASGTVLGLSANTGGYKTSAAISAGVNMWQAGARVDYVSMEMDQELLVQRILSRACGIDYSDIVDGRLDYKQHATAEREAQKVWRLFLESNTGSFRVHDSSAMGGQTIDDALAILEAKTTDVLIVDHLALFDAADGQDDQLRLLINDNAKRLHKAAVASKVAVILLVQGTDELGHRESRSLNTHIDWDLRWVLGKEERQYGIIEVSVCKWRTGKPPESMLLDVDFARNRLTSLSDENPRVLAYKAARTEKKDKKYDRQ